jgi:hypothetical protein
MLPTAWRRLGRDRRRLGRDRRRLGRGCRRRGRDRRRLGRDRRRRGRDRRRLGGRRRRQLRARHRRVRRLSSGGRARTGPAAACGRCRRCRPARSSSRAARSSIVVRVGDGWSDAARSGDGSGRGGRLGRDRGRRRGAEERGGTVDAVGPQQQHGAGDERGGKNRGSGDPFAARRLHTRVSTNAGASANHAKRLRRSAVLNIPAEPIGWPRSRWASQAPPRAS